MVSGSTGGRRPSRRRRRRPFSLSLALWLLLGVAVLGGGAWVVHHFLEKRPQDGPARPDPPRDTTATAGPSQLDAWVGQLASFEPEVRARAERGLERSLLDPRQRSERAVVGRTRSGSPEEWYREPGAARLVPALLARFRSGVGEEVAARILAGLTRAWPVETATAAGGPLPGSEALTFLDEIRLLGRRDPLRLPYALYLLEAGGEPPGVTRASLLLEVHRNASSRHLRDRVQAILLRVEDISLTRIARHRSDLVGNVLGDLGREVDPGSSAALQRRQTLERGLAGAGESASLLAALERYRWDPVPPVDPQVLELARGAHDRAVRAAALRALRALPGATAARHLGEALEVPRYRGTAVSVLSQWTGETAGTRWGAWDLAATPSETLQALEVWRAWARRLEEGAGSVGSAFSTGQPEPWHYRWLPLLAARGDLDPTWYRTHGPMVVRGLESPDPAVRRSTLAAIAHWETPAALPILARLYLEEADPRVQQAFIDTILGVGGPASVTVAVEEIVARGQFEGVELIEIYRWSFPTSDLRTPLRAVARSAAAERRATAAYLLSALPPHEETAGVLLALLNDPDERSRFWADRALARMYNREVKFDPKQPDPDGVQRWYQIVRERR